MDTVGKRLKMAREYLKMSQDEMAKSIGSTKRGYQENEKGKTTPSSKTIEGFVRIGINANWLVAGIGEMLNLETRKTPKQLTQSVMVPCLSEDLTVISHMPFKRDYLENRQCDLDKIAIVYSHGDSMEPSIKSCDSLLIDTQCTTPNDGNLFVFKIGQNLLAKRVQQQLNGDLTLLSDNPAYLPHNVRFNELDKLETIGQVIWIGKEIQDPNRVTPIG